MFLPDINVWLALAFDTHTHHADAKKWRDSVMNEHLFFCRLTQMGFLRLSTNPKVFPADAVSLSATWQMYDSILNNPYISYAAEPADIEIHWRSFTQGQSLSPHVWNDAYLAAFSLAAQLEVVTFDRGFANFQNVKCAILPSLVVNLLFRSAKAASAVAA